MFEVDYVMMRLLKLTKIDLLLILNIKFGKSSSWMFCRKYVFSLYIFYTYNKNTKIIYNFTLTCKNFKNKAILIQLTRIDFKKKAL